VAGSSVIPKEPAKSQQYDLWEGIKRKIESIEEIEARYLFPGTRRNAGPIYTADVYRGGFFRDRFLSFSLFFFKETVRISDESSGRRKMRTFPRDRALIPTWVTDDSGKSIPRFISGPQGPSYHTSQFSRIAAKWAVEAQLCG